MEKDVIQRVNEEEVSLPKIYERWYDPKKEIFGVCYQMSRTHKSALEFEYIDMKSLHNFLFAKIKAEHCMIQKFVFPNSETATTLRAEWSKDFTILTCRTNINMLNNPKIPLENRCCTFEGGEKESRELVPKPDLKRRLIDSICREICAHIESLSGKNIEINHMELLLRTDSSNVLWVMICTELKFINPWASKGLHNGNIKHGAPHPGTQVSEQRKGFSGDKPKSQLRFILLHPSKEVEIQDFLTSIRLESSKQHIEHNPNNVHCSLCLEVKPLDCNLKIRHLLHYLKFTIKPDYEIMELDGAAVAAKRFIKSVAKGEVYAEKSLKEVNAKEPGDANDPLGEDTVDSKIPQIFMWIFGPQTVQSLVRKFKNRNFQNIEFKVCSECFLRYTDRVVKENFEYDYTILDKVVKNRLKFQRQKMVKIHRKSIEKPDGFQHGGEGNKEINIDEGNNNKNQTKYSPPRTPLFTAQAANPSNLPHPSNPLSLYPGGIRSSEMTGKSIERMKSYTNLSMSATHGLKKSAKGEFGNKSDKDEKEKHKEFGVRQQGKLLEMNTSLNYETEALAKSPYRSKYCLKDVFRASKKKSAARINVLDMVANEDRSRVKRKLEDEEKKAFKRFYERDVNTKAVDYTCKLEKVGDPEIDLIRRSEYAKQSQEETNLESYLRFHRSSSNDIQAKYKPDKLRIRTSSAPRHRVTSQTRPNTVESSAEGINQQPKHTQNKILAVLQDAKLLYEKYNNKSRLKTKQSSSLGHSRVGQSSQSSTIEEIIPN